MTQMSSMREARRGSSSLTSIARLAVLGELPRRGEQVAGLGPFELRLLERQRLAVVGCQARLGIEQIDVRRPAGHVEEDDPLGLGADDAARGRRRDCAARSGAIGRCLRGQQVGQGQQAEAAAGAWPAVRARGDVNVV